MTIFGWDLSHYDNPDSRSAVDEGLKFFTHKAGGDANDAELGQWWALMKPSRGTVLLGAYWVLYPGSPASRADAFLARLDAQCPGWRDSPFILQADCEIWGGNPGTKPGRADIEAFCDRLHAKMPKLWPIVYAPKWAYGDSLAGLSYPLWASSYVSGTGSAKALYPGDDSPRWAPYSGQTPEILQFSSSATIGGQTTSDANAYRGTLAQLTALVAPGWQPQEERETDVTLADEQILITSSSAPLFTPGRTSAAASEFLALSAIYAKRANDNAAAAGTAITTLTNVVAGLDTVDEAALGSAIQAGLVPAISASVTAGVVAALADADVELTPELIQAQVEAGVRNVLGGLDAVPTA